MLLFSIIIPIYNSEKYLKECIDSIILQSYKNYEIILIDDGSKDKSFSICENYAKKYNFIKIIHKVNEGIVIARQKGVEIAKGKYIICIDSDDFIEKNYLEKFAEVIIKTNSDIVCCGYINYYSENNKRKILIPQKKGFYNKKDIENIIFPILIEKSDGSYFRPSLWAKAIKKEIYQKYQLKDTVINMGEDYACTRACIYHSRSMYILEECLYYYRYNINSITKKTSYSWDIPKIILKHFEKNIDMNNFDFKEQSYRFIVHSIFNIAVSRFYNNKYKNVRDELYKEIKEKSYKKAIKECKYKKNIKGKLAHLVLYYKMVFMIYIFFLLKNINIRRNNKI
ncbi:glycosyltransferase family 2 protein [Fusobacterium sp. SB021]|uniref:glycosyltransferase family 2 protein n=1 Tax=Fusobacterium sp. SB021 TaxID=2744227 RepID=UPI003CECE28C